MADLTLSGRPKSVTTGKNLNVGTKYVVQSSSKSTRKAFREYRILKNKHTKDARNIEVETIQVNFTLRPK